MRRYLWAGTVLVLLIVTVVLLLTSTDAGDYGWFAYTPDSGKIEGGPDLVLMSHTRAAACGVGALTLIALAAGAGYAVGRRSRPAS